MRKKNLIILTASLLISALSATAVSAQAAYDDPPTGGNWWIKSVQAGNQNLGYWDQPGLITEYKFNQGSKITVYAKDNGLDQKFYFIPAPEKGWYYIRTMNGDGCIDLPNGKNANGVQLIVYKSNNQNNQKFRFKHLGNGRWKIYASTGKAVCLANRSIANDTAVHTWDDHDGPWMEWYIVNDSTGNYMPPSAKGSSDRVTTKYTLRDAIENEDAREQYFSYVDAAKFKSENAGKELQAWLNGLEAMDQWNAVYKIMSSAKANKDLAARRAILAVLVEVNIKKGKGFAEKAALNILRKGCQDEANAERDTESKRLINELAGKL